MCWINKLIDEAKCYDEIRKKRWPHGVRCPHCASNKISKRGKNHRQQECRRYSCKNCGKRFDDLTGTIFMGRHQPLSVWFTFLYLMGLNVSNQQIAEELGLNASDGQAMAERLRGGIVQRRANVRMTGVVECDEVYVVAGHKGRPEKIKGRRRRRRRLKGAPGRGTLEKEKPPIFGMIERGGEVRMIMLENVRQHTIRPFIEETIEPGTVVNTDEYVIYDALPQWGYVRKSVCHRPGSMPVTRTATVSTKCMSTRWKVSGRCCALGCAPIAAFLRKSCRFTWGSLSSCTMSDGVAEPCWGHFWTRYCNR
jgi:transposase-like protein